MMKRMVIGAAFLALLSVAQPASASLITNGSFETGTFSSWTQFGNTGFTGVEAGGTDGSFEAFFGPVGSTGGITQNATGSLAGGVYQVTFDLQHDGGTPNSFDVSFGGASLYSFSNGPGFGYTSYSFNTTALVNNAALAFTFRQDPAFFRLDNVRVEAIPEPASMLLLGTGLAAAAVRRRMKKA